MCFYHLMHEFIQMRCLPVALDGLILLEIYGRMEICVVILDVFSDVSVCRFLREGQIFWNDSHIVRDNTEG